MNIRSVSSNGAFTWFLQSVGPASAITVFLWASTGNDISPIDGLLAFVLLLIPWHSYRQWHRKRGQLLPLFAMLALMYWLYYAMQLFWGDLLIDVANSPLGREAEPGLITEATLMAVIGVASLWLGLRSGVGAFLKPRRMPEVLIRQSRWNYVRAVLVLSSLLSFMEPSLLLFGAGGRQPLSILLSIVPMLAFMLLFRGFLRGEASSLDKLLIIGFLVARSIGGLSSGWLGSFTSIIIVCGAAYIAERRRIPRIAVAAVVLFVLFFQVGKEDFRRTYWTEAKEATKVERVSFWVNSSLERWGDALADPSGGSIQTLFGRSLSRVALLTQTANVLEQTPSVVPYQYGKLYSYLFITWIPRVVWPNKPSINDANQFYQVAYGVTNEEDLGNVAIAVGVLTEGYINFGWPGVFTIMFLIGIFLDLYVRFLFGPSSGLVLSSLGIVLLPQALGVESQMATYLGGIIQQVALSLLVLLPALRLGKQRASVALPLLRQELMPGKN